MVLGNSSDVMTLGLWSITAWMMDVFLTTQFLLRFDHTFQFFWNIVSWLRDFELLIQDEVQFLARTLCEKNCDAKLHRWWFKSWLNNPLLKLLRRWNVFLNAVSWMSDFKFWLYVTADFWPKHNDIIVDKQYCMYDVCFVNFTMDFWNCSDDGTFSR